MDQFEVLERRVRRVEALVARVEHDSTDDKIQLLDLVEQVYREHTELKDLTYALLWLFLIYRISRKVFGD